MAQTLGEVAPRTPQLVVEGAVAADLALVLSGVRLPWARLGGSASEPPRWHTEQTIEVAIPLGVVPDIKTNCLVLTDPSLVPLAALHCAEIVERAESPAVRGRLRPLCGSTVSDWVTHAPTAIAQRPLLDSDSRCWDTILAPTGPSPDGIPANVMRNALEAALRSRACAGSVVSAPIVWRDPASDEALVAAITARLGEKVDVLSASDREWVTAFQRLDGGSRPDGLAPPVAAVLSRWHPPRAQRGLVLFFTGLSGSGKSTLAAALADRLERDSRRTVSLLDGDLVRRMLSSGLGFDRAGRDANVLRIGYVAAEIARHGGIAVCAPIAPFAAAREAVRAMAESVGDFVLVHVATPLSVCEARDRKGLYGQARSGALADFTGISSPYETPLDADLTIDTTHQAVEESVAQILAFVGHGGWLG